MPTSAPGLQSAWSTFLNDYEITLDNDLIADAVRDLVIGDINEHDFADILYSCFIASKNQA